MEEGPMEYRVTTKAPYIQAKSLTTFFQGLPAKEAKDGKEAKPARAAQDEIIVIALGNAISQAGEVINKVTTGKKNEAGELEDPVAYVVKVETGYPKIPSRNVELQVAQLRIHLKKTADLLPAVDEADYHPGKLKGVKKEGGKKGAELTGAADMGGIEWFTTTCETPQGDPKLLEIVNQEMNAEINPEEEESKGGSGRVAKFLLSASDKQLALLAYVPKDKTSTTTAQEWMKSVLEALGGGEVVTDVDSRKSVAILKADEKKGVFPIKKRDEAISKSVAFLQAKGLIPEGGDDSSDYMVFGDDDFPS